MVKHVMLDIETLSTSPDAVVLSIGAVEFGLVDGVWSVGQGIELSLNIDDQIAKGRKVSGDTLRWWLGQSEDARMSVIEGPPKSQNYPTLMAVANFVNDGYVWGKGSDFDNVIVASLFGDYGIEPWKFYMNRCYRTLEYLGKQNGVPVPRMEGVAHSALDDARHQATHAATICNHMGLDML